MVFRAIKYARFDAAAAVCNGKIYVCGGQNNSLEPLRNVECFDPKSGIWTDLVEIPALFTACSLVSYRNKLIIMGGRDDEGYLFGSLELDPLEENGQWKEFPSMTILCSIRGAIVLDREIFAFGTHYALRDLQVEIFDGRKWVTGPAFPLKCLSLSTVLIPQDFAERLCDFKNTETP